MSFISRNFSNWHNYLCSYDQVAIIHDERPRYEISRNHLMVLRIGCMHSTGWVSRIAWAARLGNYFSSHLNDKLSHNTYSLVVIKVLSIRDLFIKNMKI